MKKILLDVREWYHQNGKNDERENRNENTLFWSLGFYAYK